MTRVFARLGRGVRRTRAFLAVAALVIVTVTAVTGWEGRQQASRERADRALGRVVHVGVLPGGSISEYARSSRTELDRLVADDQREVYALITLGSYLAPDRLTPVVGGVEFFEVYARMPAPGGASRIERVPAAGYRELCACVYAAVVRAKPAALDVVAARPEVRIVDPAPEVRRLDATVFLPPLPEQTDRKDPTASPSAR
jgi:hypothetical protein